MRNLTTLAFWLRSSVVSVLYSLTTITVPLGLVCCFLIFAGLLGGCELARSALRDDLATALLACVVRASLCLFVFPLFRGFVVASLFGGVPDDLTNELNRIHVGVLFYVLGRSSSPTLPKT